MKKIITRLEPFSMTQIIYTYEDGNKIDIIENIKTNEIADKILEVAKAENICNIEFVGPHSFAQGIGNKILEKELANYDVHNIEIKYL